MNTEHTNQPRQAEPVNQQLLALVKSFGHKTGCAKNAFGERCTCGVDEAIAAAEQAQQAEPVGYGKTPGCKQCDEAEACGLTFCPECDAQFCAGHDGAEEIAAQPPAVAVAVPDGYALVPIEPTAQMVEAGFGRDDDNCKFWLHPAQAYRVMLAAAPQATAEDSSVVGGAGAAPAEWPTAQDVGRIGDMSKVASLRVGLDADNDVYVSIANEEGMTDVEFCVPGSGGGKSPRTRAALISLMVAMEADNAETPSRNWWKARDAAAQKGGAA